MMCSAGMGLLSFDRLRMRSGGWENLVEYVTPYTKCRVTLSLSSVIPGREAGPESLCITMEILRRLHLAG
jgi:hypothetical protein